MQGCNVAHVLGLYKMTGRPGLAFELTAAGSVADVALWGIARLQTRMYASETFQRYYTRYHHQSINEPGPIMYWLSLLERRV